MERLITLREALMSVGDASHDAVLFLPPDEVWRLGTRCAILKVDPYGDSEADPPFALQNGLRRALSVAQTQDVVENARLQVARPTPEQLLAAFLFYYDRDAFIDFGKP